MKLILMATTSPWPSMATAMMIVSASLGRPNNVGWFLSSPLGKLWELRALQQTQQYCDNCKAIEAVAGEFCCLPAANLLGATKEDALEWIPLQCIQFCSMEEALSLASTWGFLFQGFQLYFFFRNSKTKYPNLEKS